MRPWQWWVRGVSLAVMVMLGLWVAGMAWFHLPLPWSRPVTLLWAVLCLVALWVTFRPRSRWTTPVCLSFVAGVLAAAVAWSQLQPAQDRIWADDVARRLKVVAFDGRHVELANVRNFNWRTETDYDMAWESRHYDLDQLRSADLFQSYWMGPAIAHTLVSFGFADGRQLVFSLEIRKEHDEQFDALAGFFRRYEMTLVASEERDIVRVRSNVRGEQVDMYRVAALQGKPLRDLFVAYLEQARALDREPAFYNTLTSNCTTIVWELARQVAPDMPLDWRLLASGYFPGYVQDLGALTPGYGLEELQQAGRITARARAADQDPEFSRAIRQGVPGMEQGAH